MRPGEFATLLATMRIVGKLGRLLPGSDMHIRADHAECPTTPHLPSSAAVLSHVPTYRPTLMPERGWPRVRPCCCNTSFAPRSTFIFRQRPHSGL